MNVLKTKYHGKSKDDKIFNKRIPRFTYCYSYFSPVIDPYLIDSNTNMTTRMFRYPILAIPDWSTLYPRSMRTAWSHYSASPVRVAPATNVPPEAKWCQGQLPVPYPFMCVTVVNWFLRQSAFICLHGSTVYIWPWAKTSDPQYPEHWLFI